MRINIGRGLFRLWLVGSLIWLLAVGIWLRPDRTVMHLWSGPSMEELAFYSTPCSAEKDCSPSDVEYFINFEKGNPSAQAVDRAEIRSDDLWRLADDAVVSFGPNVAVLMLGTALLWAIRGFRIAP